MREMEAADWASLSDQELLERRISTLGLRLEGTALEPLIRQLYDELSANGLAFHPPCHIGDEWFVPVGIPAIFIPFFLVHDRLRALERTMMLEVEGGTPEWFMKLMRHEAGHAYTYAYQLTRRKNGSNVLGKHRGRKRRTLTGHAHSAVVTSFTLRIGMRRVIQTRISPKHLRSGSRRSSIGAKIMLAGRHSEKWNTLMS